MEESASTFAQVGGEGCRPAVYTQDGGAGPSHGIDSAFEAGVAGVGQGLGPRNSAKVEGGLSTKAILGLWGLRSGDLTVSEL